MLIIIYFLTQKLKIKIYYKEPFIFKRLVFRGIVGSFAFSCIVFSIKLISFTEAFPIIYSMPIWTGILGIYYKT